VTVASRASSASAVLPRIGRAMLPSAAGIALGLFFGGLLAAIIATRLFGYQVLTVRSESMAPAIRAGDLIVVKPVPIDRLEPGDIVLFASGGDAIPTVHRVAGVNTIALEVRDTAGQPIETLTDYRLVTQGDANPLPDASEVTASQLRGEVWFTIPGGGVVAGMPLQIILAAVAATTTLTWIAWEAARRLRS
jgi:signal peptidase I